MPSSLPDAFALDQVSLHRGATTLLNDVTCRVSHGGVAALLGPNGCGKTTLADAVVTGFFATVGLYDAPTADQRERAAALLKQVGLPHRLDHRFGTLSTGEQRRALIARALATAGEQRRALIARALATAPELLILDEPSAGLDLAGREDLLATVDNLLTGPEPPALLQITHHPEELSPRTPTTARPTTC